MKAELLIRGYCIHIVNHAELAKQQSKRPVTIKEIDQLEPFSIDNVNKSISHQFLSEKTLQVSTLIGRESYYSLYRFDNDLLKEIRLFNRHRNSLHFNKEPAFQLSEQLINTLERMNRFVDQILNSII